MPIILTSDIPDKVAALIDAGDLAVYVAGANSRAVRVAPCLGVNPTADQLAEAKLILIGAVSRWARSGEGAYSQMTAGPYSVTTDSRERGGFNFWPSEITNLQELCSSNEREAFSIDTVPELGDE